MQYFTLIFALISSLCIAIMLKVLEQKNRNRTVLIASNYISAGVLGIFLTPGTAIAGEQFSVYVFLYAVVVGFFFFVAFMVFSKAIKSQGIAGAVTVGRLSLALPVCFSIFLWGEKPLLLDILSLLMILAIILSWEGKIGKISPILLALFLLLGSLDTALKYFKLEFPKFDDGFFLVILFFSAMVWGWSYVGYSRTKPKRQEVLWGLMLGIPNFFASYFLLKALALIPAYIVFPFVYVGVIILSAMAGVIIFKEKLSGKKLFLIFLGIVAVIVLTT